MALGRNIRMTGFAGWVAMNIILIISDTLRPQYLGCYGNAWIRTPNIDALAKQACLFTHFHAASFPTGPMRKDLHSGRYTFPYTSWKDEWKPRHKVLAEYLSGAGYLTAMVSDTPANQHYQAGFDHFEMIPGQVGGGMDLGPDEKMDLPADIRKLRTPVERLYRIVKTESKWKGEEDRFAAQTMRAAARWLEGRHGGDKPFFLYVDTFDPHEPWDPPRYYIDRYDPGYEGDELFEPAYEPAGYATDPEIRHMRFMYAGEVSMVDRWVGHLLRTVEEMGLVDDTAVVLTSDHGFYHGEHNFIGKVQLHRDGRIVLRYPLYRTISHAPLLVRIPCCRRRKLEGFVQPPDLMPTLLEIAGAKVPSHVQGRSLLPEIRGDQARGPGFAVSSYTYRQDAEVRCPTSLRTREFLYVYGGDEWQSEFYDLRRDPGERNNILKENPDQALEAHRLLVSFLDKIGCPRQSLKMRRSLSPRPRRSLPPSRIL